MIQQVQEDDNSKGELHNHRFKRQTNEGFLLSPIRHFTSKGQHVKDEVEDGDNKGDDQKEGGVV